MNGEVILVIGILLLAAAFTIILVYSSFEYGIFEGEVRTIETSLCLTNPDISCEGQNPQSPYGRPIFIGRGNTVFSTEISASVLQARKLAENEAIAIYGNIPQGYLYWGVTGYLYDIEDPATQKRTEVFASIGDSVSSGSIQGRAKDGFAAIMTVNPQVYAEAKMSLEKEWLQENPGTSIQIAPLFIPPYMYNLQSHYLPIVRTELRQLDHPLPNYQTKLYRYANVPFIRVPITYYKERSESPREQDLLGESQWSTVARNLVSAKYTILAEYTSNVYLYDQIPGGINEGYQCLYNSDWTPRSPPLNCRGDNRDNVYFVSPAFTITPQMSIAVVAINHAASLRATYSSIAFYSVKKEYGYTSVITGEVPVPAEASLQANLIINNPDPSFFVDGTFDAAIIERAYVEPITGIGPSATSILSFYVYSIVAAPSTVEGPFLI